MYTNEYLKRHINTSQGGKQNFIQHPTVTPAMGAHWEVFQDNSMPSNKRSTDGNLLWKGGKSSS